MFLRFSKITLIMFCLCFFYEKTLAAKEYDFATMTIQGHAVVRKPADELQLTVGVISQAKTANDALKNNSQKMENVLKALQELGLTSAEYQTSRFSINPIYSTPPKNPSPDWIATINGYEVSNQVAIKTEQITLAGPIIDTVSQFGVNSIQNISFQLKNQREHYSEAIGLATQYALEDAQKLAQGAHVDLLRIVDIVLEKPSPSYQPRLALYSFKGADNGNSAQAIASGEVEVTADVSITYEIK